VSFRRSCVTAAAGPGVGAGTGASGGPGPGAGDQRRAVRGGGDGDLRGEGHAAGGSSALGGLAGARRGSDHSRRPPLQGRWDYGRWAGPIKQVPMRCTLPAQLSHRSPEHLSGHDDSRILPPITPCSPAPARARSSTEATRPGSSVPAPRSAGAPSGSGRDRPRSGGRSGSRS
jgi:hypothetical protein